MKGTKSAVNLELPTPADMPAQTAGLPDAAEENDFRPITSQAEFDKRIGPRLGEVQARFADYDQLKAQAAELAQIREAEKTELERISDRATAAEQALAAAEAKALRLEIAADAGLPANLLTGSTREELEAQATALCEFRNAGAQVPRAPKPDPSQGQIAPPNAEPQDWLRDTITRR